MTKLMILTLVLSMVVPFIMNGDVCWIENYLDVDWVVCEVEGGIYIQEPSETPVRAVRRVNAANPECTMWNRHEACDKVDWPPQKPECSIWNQHGDCIITYPPPMPECSIWTWHVPCIKGGN